MIDFKNLKSDAAVEFLGSKVNAELKLGMAEYTHGVFTCVLITEMAAELIRAAERGDANKMATLLRNIQKEYEPVFGKVV